MWVEKHGNGWRIRDRVGARIVTVRGDIATKSAARALMTTLKADRIRGDQLVHRGGQVTVADWVDSWWPSYEVTLKPSSRLSARGIVGRYIRPMLGDIRLDDLDPVTVQRWVADLLAGRTKAARPKPLSRKTVANAHGLLHKILAEAVAQRLIRVNPCGRTRLPQRVHFEMQFLTEPEAQRLLVAVPEHYRTLILLLLGTGLRFGEATGLLVKDVDVLDGRLYVRRNLQQVAGTGLVEGTPKTAAGRRTVTFTADLAGELAGLVAGRDGEERVFESHTGGPVRQRQFFPTWNRARIAAGLPRLRIHDLRHTHAAWLISSRILGGLTTVQRRLGHSSYQVTSDLYGHLMPEVDADVLLALDTRLPRSDRGSTVGATGSTEENRKEPSGTEIAVLRGLPDIV